MAKEEARRERELLEFLAAISGKPEHERALRALEQREAEEREAQERQRQIEEEYDETDHPRRPKGSPGGGQWVGKDGGGSGNGEMGASDRAPVGFASYSGPKRGAIERSLAHAAGDRRAGADAGPFQTATYRPGQSQVQLTAAGGAAPAYWPTFGPASSWLPKVGPGAGAAAGVGAGIAAGAFLGALRNDSMRWYWGSVPGARAMPDVWKNELEKRIRAGTLSVEDATGIFNMAVLGAEAQGFKPTGNVISAVHRSITDFLGKAEAVYFARKKEKGWAKQPGGYQLSGGRVFPTKNNSGLDGDVLRNEQEKFFERGLAEGKDPAYLRGQAVEAGSPRAGGWGRPDDRIIDPEAEAALQRAIKNAGK